MKKFIKDFKTFINRGNIVDMAIGVIIANSFSAIVKSLTNDILMPILTLFFGAESLSKLSICLKYDELGNPSLTWNYGIFLQSVLDFFIVALCLFVFLKVFMNSQKLINETVNGIKNKKPTKEEKIILIEKNINLDNKEETMKALLALREENKIKAELEAKQKYKPTELDVLNEIKTLLKENIKKE